MESGDTIDDIKLLDNIVQSKKLEIYQNKIFEKYLKAECRKMDRECEKLRGLTEKRIQEIEFLKQQNDEIKKLIPLQELAVNISQESVKHHETLLKYLEKDIAMKNEKQNERIYSFNTFFDECKKQLISGSTNYILMKRSEIEFKKSNIALMQLKQNIKVAKANKKMFNEIQQQMLNAKIVKLARVSLLARKAAEMRKLADEARIEKDELIRQHLEKQKSKEDQNLFGFLETPCGSVMSQKPKEPSSSIFEKLQKLVQATSVPFMKPHFVNKQKKKVQILDISIIKPKIVEEKAEKVNNQQEEMINIEPPVAKISEAENVSLEQNISNEVISQQIPENNIENEITELSQKSCETLKENIGTNIEEQSNAFRVPTVEKSDFPLNQEGSSNFFSNNKSFEHLLFPPVNENEEVLNDINMDTNFDNTFTVKTPPQSKSDEGLFSFGFSGFKLFN